MIALAVLGLIATFVISQVIQNIDTSVKKAVFKDVQAIVSGSFQAFLADQAPRQPSSIHSSWLRPYLNGLEPTTSSQYGVSANSGSHVGYLCNAPNTSCYLYPSSHAVINFGNGNCATNTTQIAVDFDIDGLGSERSFMFFVDRYGKVSNQYQISQGIVVGYGSGPSSCPQTPITQPPIATGKPAWLD